MKRVLSVFLSFVLIFSLASCAAEEAKAENDTTILLKIGSPTISDGRPRLEREGFGKLSGVFQSTRRIKRTAI